MKKLYEPWEVFGNMILIEELLPVQKKWWNRERRVRIGKFQCFCGREITHRFHWIELKQSCGCIRGTSNIKHWLSIIRNMHPYWRIVHGVRTRCCNINSKDYKRYGGRWIKIYEEWMNDLWKFAEYLSTYLPKRRIWETLDRIDVNWNYEPWNLRRASCSQQANNKRNNCTIEYKGKTQNISQWALESGINVSTLAQRYHKKWDRWENLFRPLDHPWTRNKTI